MGGKHCCYGLCNSDSRYPNDDDMQGVFFIPFPKPPPEVVRRKYPRRAKKLLEKCIRWINACGRPREDFNIHRLRPHTYICSKHFVGENGPTITHPDPIMALPVRFILYYTKAKGRKLGFKIERSFSYWVLFSCLLLID